MVVYASFGRGGAGNMADPSMIVPQTPKDHILPPLQTAYVTTGRGGCGNMALNVNPAETRLRQDVVEVIRTPMEQVYAHGGRGGAGNVFRMEDLRYYDEPLNGAALSQVPRRRSSEIVNKAIAFFRK